MQRKLAVLGICLATLGACTQPMQIAQNPVHVTPNAPKQAFGLDVYAAARQQGQPAPAYKGERLVTVRSEFDGPSSGTTEFSGARCKITSATFSAEVTTPVQIVVPDYGAQSPVITANCRANDMQATQSISVFNASQRRRDQAREPFLFGGYGRHGGGISVGVHFDLSDRSNDVYEYPTLRVTFR